MHIYYNIIIFNMNIVIKINCRILFIIFNIFLSNVKDLCQFKAI